MTRAFLDIDTQIDFMFPAGALYVPGAECIVDTIAQLNRYAVDHGILLISTACAHSEDDPEFAKYGPHCVVGTVGQLKPAALLVGQRIFEKQTTNVFDAPGAEELLTADEFVVYGVVTEICIQAAALGLLHRKKQVAVVTDAIASLDAHAADKFLTEFVKKGGRTITSGEACQEP
jgi:nicotinamidase/pyrazinamidase